MSTPSSLPLTLESLISRMAQQAPSREPALLLGFRDALRRRDVSAARGLFSELQAKGLLEEAHERVRESVRQAPSLQALKLEMDPLAEQARTRRSANWQLDSKRVRVRLRFARGAALVALGTPELQTLLVEALRLEGLRPALELSRNPKPLLQIAPPLSVGVEGLRECAECELFEPVREPVDEIVHRLNARLPEGLDLVAWAELPTWASASVGLAREAHYAWPCALPPEQVRAKVEAFLAAETFPMGKAGKVEGQKAEKVVDLRPHVTEMHLDRGTLRFTMALQSGVALNPLKLLGGVLGLEANTVQGLLREDVILEEDPRLAKAERFETKLKNIYEDATLLTSGGNITLVDEDDDEPLVLG
ncbi:MAG TPA: TIGR03936 family radical SAM-associated protein [Holophagaceae bacterium]|nr:TIGR03936 family radical SAM-associated protein [Holophagaceae bacterium]